MQGALMPRKKNHNNNNILDTFVLNVMINNNIETSEDNFTLRLSASRTRQAGESRPLKDSEW